MLLSDSEVAFTAITEIFAWIFTITIVSGTLVSLLIESDTENQNFLTRIFAVKHYMVI